MKSIGQLLRKAREESKISVEEISKELESKDVRASKKTIYSWENGNSQPTPYAFLYMCKRYGIQNPTVYFGCDDNEAEKSLIAVPPHYADLLDEYKAIVDVTSDQAYKAQTMAVKSAIAAMQEDAAADTSDNVIPFRFSEQPFSAGRGVYLGPEAFREINVLRNELTERADFGGPVEGDSMEPKYHDGDILAVSTQEYPEPGEIGIFSLDGCGYVKKLGNGELISLNRKYDPIPMDDSIRCNGKVIGVLDHDWIVEK